jgi:hypothetical protein
MHLWCGGGGGGGGEQVHNVDYDPGPWRQTLSLPPPGIEPGSPVSQAGTLPQELSRLLILRVVGASQLNAREGTNIKFASAGDRTRVACITGGHST